jgi:hypothetical protein
MRRLLRISALWMVCLLSLFRAAPVLAVPPLPSSFYGMVKLWGSNVPVDTALSVRINGVSYAATTVTMYNGDTVYSLGVPGDDPGTPAIIEGGVVGDTVEFYIGGFKADQIAPWQSGSNAQLNLTASPTFADVPTDYWARDWIERLYAAGITSGCGTSPRIYCPETSVTRAQMAIFLERGMNGSAYIPPAGTGLIFMDVPGTYWAMNWIEKLYADGITSGCGSGNYCPENPVTRDQMAIFLLRARHGSAYTPPDAIGVFADVPTSYWAAAWIERLYTEGVTQGCNITPLTYCPDSPVTRAQMAVFLVRTFNLP